MFVWCLSFLVKNIDSTLFFPEDCKVAAIVDLEGIDESFYSSFNETDIHLKCLIQEHIEQVKYGNSTEYCPTSSDSILCWPRTYKGVLAVLSCLDEFQGIQYDINREFFFLFLKYFQTIILFHKENATRLCQLNGTWEQRTNYEACQHLPATSTIPEFDSNIELPTIIYYVGYTLSLVSLTLAVLVFTYFKWVFYSNINYERTTRI